MADTKSEDEKSGLLPDDCLQVTICGGGNGAHVFALSLSASFSPRYRVNWLSLHGDEMSRVEEAMKKNDGYLEGHFKQENTIIRSRPHCVSNDASKVIPGSDIIIICLPSFAHKFYLDTIKKHHELCNGTNKDPNKRLLVVAFPCGSGFDVEYLGRVGGNFQQVALFGGDTLPWACRIATYGSHVTILGVKPMVSGYLRANKDFVLGSDKLRPLEVVQSFFLDGKPRIDCDINVHFLTSTLRGELIHPSILYDKWQNYDEKEMYDEMPLFYQGLTQSGAKLICDLSDESGELIRQVNDICRKKGYFLSKEEKIAFVHERDWYVATYGKQATKNDTLFDIITTNPSYNGLTHPMKKIEEVDGKKLDKVKYMPNFEHRYFAEDIPYSLLNVKAVACLMVESGYKVNVPLTDKILLWAQKMMGKKYVVKKDNGYVDVDVNSEDVQKRTRVPQVYGIKTIDQLLKMHSA